MKSRSTILCVDKGDWIEALFSVWAQGIIEKVVYDLIVEKNVGCH